MILFQILAVCGMLSPIIYTAMWVMIGSKQSEYSHIRDDISSLFAVGAPNRRVAQSFVITESVATPIKPKAQAKGENGRNMDKNSPTPLIR